MQVVQHLFALQAAAVCCWSVVDWVLMSVPATEPDLGSAEWAEAQSEGQP